MIPYELATQLKESGFPQYKNGNGRVFYCKHVQWCGKCSDRNDELIIVPTLSELIAACPKSTDDGFFSLSFIYDKWFCGYEKYEIFKPEGNGQTPEEAVAMLWLELNK